jgi:glycosyltransferase involved in cell wall biosynthesis
MKAHSAGIRQEARSIRGRLAPRRSRFDFVGNIANSLYARAVPLRKMGYEIGVHLHPHDTYIMSQPGWEEFDGDLPDGGVSLEELQGLGIDLPSVPGVYRSGLMTGGSALRLGDLPPFVRRRDALRWPGYLCYLPTLQALQEADALLAMQVPYLAYLANRPYLVTQMGGDIWYECARDDEYGRLQRQAFHTACAFLVSNPWSFSHARRYGMRHLVYLPMMLDETVYSPGQSAYRDEWTESSRGSFIVLSTARLDDYYKGSGVAIEGFARFSRKVPGARLVIVGWGSDRERYLSQLTRYGIADKVIVLPIAGKRRLIGYLRAADCLLDQFVLGYLGATALEAMACGLPVIMRLERGQYDALAETGAPPVLDADGPEQVLAHLSRLSEEPEYRASYSRLHRDWFLANHSSARWREAYVDMLTAVAAGHRFDFNGSPLAAPLGGDERAYHATELASAPSFPSYA